MCLHESPDNLERPVMWVLVVKLWDEYRQGWELSVSRFSLSLDAATVWHRGRSVYGRRPLAACALWRTQGDGPSELVRTEN